MTKTIRSTLALLMFAIGAMYLAALPARAADCITIGSEVVPLSICLDPDIWTRAQLDNDNEHNFKLKTEERYLMIITEKDFFPQDQLKKAILINAQSAAGLEKVNVKEETTAVIDGKEFNRIIYQTIVNDLDVTYTNYYTGFEGTGSVQLVFFVLSPDQGAYLPTIEEVAASIALTN